MLVDPTYNFKDPLKLTIIFKEPIFEEGELDKLQDDLESMGITVKVSSKTREYNEFSGFIVVRWEDVIAIKSYPYKDEWKTFKGSKYYITISELGPEYLVYGSYDEIVAYWTEFRNRYKEF